MEDEELHQAHDKLFKAGFSVPENTAALLAAELPASLSRHVDWARLELRSGTYVDSDLRESASDLLFAAPVAGRAGFVYVLFEHQTSADPRLGLRLLRYMLRIWERVAKETPPSEKLPLILPVVLAQNKEVWKIDPSFASLLDFPPETASDFAEIIPNFTYRLLQLAEMPFESIVGTPAGVFILRTMKAERLGELLSDAVWDEDLMMLVSREVFELVLRYVLAADIDKNQFLHKLKAVHQPKFKIQHHEPSPTISTGR